MLNNILESVLHAQGRFRTINNITPAYDDERIVLRSVREYCDLAVTRDGKPFKLRCYLARDHARRERLGAVSAFLAAIGEPVYGRFSYHESEMLLFDDAGGHRYIDVSLEEICDGKPFKRYLAGARNYDESLARLAAFARRHALNHLSIGNLLLSSVLFDPDGRPRICAFSGSCRVKKSDDLRTLATMISVAVTAKADRRALELLPAASLDGIPTPDPHLHALATGPYGLPDKVTRCLALALGGEPGGTSDAPTPDYTEQLLDAIDRAVSADIRPSPGLSRFLDSVCGEPETSDPAEDTGRKWTFVGQMHDMLMAACDGERWCYLDKHTNIAIPGPFTEASDFCEGIARVGKGEFFGLIDRTGRYILPPVYGDIELDESANRLVLTREGLSGLARWSGEEVTPLVYDQILPSAEKIFVVKKDGRYGYITRDGDPVTEIVFEDAQSFSGGRAKVVLKGRRYVIGTDGRTIDEIVG